MLHTLDENNLWFKAISVWALVIGSALIKTKAFEANLPRKISHRTLMIRKTEHIRKPQNHGSPLHNNKYKSVIFALFKLKKKNFKIIHCLTKTMFYWKLLIFVASRETRKKL